MARSDQTNDTFCVHRAVPLRISTKARANGSAEPNSAVPVVVIVGFARAGDEPA